jgi:hypothetical protein
MHLHSAEGGVAEARSVKERAALPPMAGRRRDGVPHGALHPGAHRGRSPVSLTIDTQQVPLTTAGALNWADTGSRELAPATASTRQLGSAPDLPPNMIFLGLTRRADRTSVKLQPSGARSYDLPGAGLVRWPQPQRTVNRQQMASR